MNTADLIDQIYFDFTKERNKLFWKTHKWLVVATYIVSFIAFLLLGVLSIFVGQFLAVVFFSLLALAGLDIDLILRLVLHVLTHRYFVAVVVGFSCAVSGKVSSAIVRRDLINKTHWIRQTLAYKKLLKKTETQLREIVNINNPQQIASVFALLKSQKTIRHFEFLLNEIQNAKT